MAPVKPNVFTNPESYTLQLVGSVNFAPVNGAYHILAVWKAPDNTLLYAIDWGSGDATPFEHQTVGDLVETTHSELFELLMEKWDHQRYLMDEKTQAAVQSEVAALIMRIAQGRLDGTLPGSGKPPKPSTHMVAHHIAEWIDETHLDFKYKLVARSDGPIILIKDRWHGYMFHAVVKDSPAPRSLDMDATEPPAGAVVIDEHGHAWQRFDDNGWFCTVDDLELSYVTWEDLRNMYGPLKIIYRP